MFKDWSEYFFMIGSSAAALIGLMFVVVTLTAGRNRSETEQGKKLYTSPIVWHLAIVMLLSGGALAPTVTPPFFAAVSGGLALLGIGIGIRNAVGISRSRISGSQNFTFDLWWYGLIPAAAYAGLAFAAGMVLRDSTWAASAVGGALMALLLISIHAEWDLVTFLAPDAPAGSQNSP